MTAPRAAQIFISYATQDGADFAADLRRKLEANDFVTWQDIVAMRGDADWWSQIESALRSKELQHFVLVVTPGALASPVVRREIRLAKQEGKTVSPVRGHGIDRLSDMPRWLGNVYDLDVSERWKNLLRVLVAPSGGKRVPMMAPEPPADFVKRPAEFEALKAHLLDAKSQDAVAITAALRGAGGYGKTTLAKALAHDQDIQDAYFDGVLWVELGEQGGGRVLALISDLVALVTGAARTMTTIEAARVALAEALGDRRILLIIDDVWQKGHLEPFLHGGKGTTRLVTTRFDSVLPDRAARQVVDAMRASEALALIGWDLPSDQVSAQSGALGAMAAHLGEWAQLLKLANGFLRERVLKHCQPLDRAIADLEKRFAARGLDALSLGKVASYEERHKSVAKVISTTLELLDEGKRARFAELGIFPEDADIPVGIVARLWAETGDYDEFASEDVLTELYSLSLLLNLDLDRRTMRFHDTTRHFLQDQAGKVGLVAQHKRLIQAMGDIGGVKETQAAETDYFYRYLPLHLAEAGDRKTLDALLLDPGWLMAKFAVTASPQALVVDYEQYGQSRMHDFIGQTLRLTSGILARDQRQLLPQLMGRLMACSDPSAPSFLSDARHNLVLPALLEERPSLAPIGAENAGHGRYFRALTGLSDGRLASGSHDGTIRFWDSKSATDNGQLEGHGGGVWVVVELPDGRLASGADDGTIRLWDLNSAAEIARLEGHEHSVNALTLLPDGRLASGSRDRTIRLWDLRSSTESVRLKGHMGCVNALALLPDGRLASGADDGTIRLWELKSGAESARLKGHGRSVNALALLPDGRLASASHDGTIRLWDLMSGAESTRIKGHDRSINALVVLPDGRLASGSHDGTICLWDLEAESENTRLDGHGGWIWALTLLADGRLASGAHDGTIELWDLVRAREEARRGDRPVSYALDSSSRHQRSDGRAGSNQGGAQSTPLEDHGGWINALTVLPDGRLASGSSDNTIRLWNHTPMSAVGLSGTEIARLDGCGGRVWALALLPDNRLASGSQDGTIRLWDLNTGAESCRLEGHDGWVNALAVLPGSRLASGADDGTIRLWDLKSGAESIRLEGHGGWVNSLSMLPDDCLAAGSDDGTIVLWDLKIRAERALLAGHEGRVWALVLLPDGRLASGADDGTIRFWDLKNGTENARLKGHEGWVNTLAILPGGRLVSGSSDDTIRIWDLESCNESARELTRIEIDAAVLSLAALSDTRVVAGDQLGRLHWLEIAN